MTELIITPKERQRMHEDQRIAAEFRAMRQAHPEATDSRIIASLAVSGNFKSKSTYGIRASLLRTNTITAKTRC